MPHRAAFPKSSRDVTSACTSVLHALSGRDDRKLGVGSPAGTANVCDHRHRGVELYAKVMYVDRSADVTSADVMGRGGDCGTRLCGAVNSIASVFVSF